MLLAILSGISADIECGYLESALLAPPGCWVRNGSDQLLGWRAVAKALVAQNFSFALDMPLYICHFCPTLGITVSQASNTL